MLNARLFCDSSAPTIYHKFARAVKKGSLMGAHLKDRKNDDYSWLNDPDYLAYREYYANHLLEHRDEYEVYTNLDIINNAQATWDNQKYFESKGLNPMPVWHFGSSVWWLLRYLKEGYEYIGIGGLVPNPYQILKPALDDIFKKYLCRPNGMPLIKVHGFAATSIRLMCRYPWWSVDSSSWIKYASFGGVMIPQLINGRLVYAANPHKINVSGKSPLMGRRGLHYTNISPQLKSHVDHYIKLMDFKMGSSTFEKVDDTLVETRIEDGLCNQPHLRSWFNALYYIGLKNQLPEWPWPFKSYRLSLWT